MENSLNNTYAHTMVKEETGNSLKADTSYHCRLEQGRYWLSKQARELGKDGGIKLQFLSSVTPMYMQNHASGVTGVFPAHNWHRWDKKNCPLIRGLTVGEIQKVGFNFFSLDTLCGLGHVMFSLGLGSSYLLNGHSCILRQSVSGDCKLLGA